MSQRNGDVHLLHPEQLRLRQLAAYYEVLSESPGCEEEMERLYVICTAPLPVEIGARRIIEFCKKWRLPAGTGAQDVCWSLPFTEVVREDIPGYPFRLEVCPRIIPNQPSVLDLARAISDPHPNETWPQIFARARGELRVELKRRAPRRVPPRHHDHDELLRMARRLYRRAVLELGWEQIAEAERDETGTYVDWRSVQSTVLDWARVLGIPRAEATMKKGRPKKQP